MLKDEGSCNDGNVVLSKRYKTSDMENGKDTSVLESRTVAIQQCCEGKLDSTADSHLDTEDRTWNDNIIWVKGNCLQRDEEKPLDLQFRSVKQSTKSTVERKESLLDEVTEEVTELELVLEGLGLSRKRGLTVGRTSSTQPNPVKPNKVSKKYPKKRMLKALPSSGTTCSVDDLKEVKERARLMVLQEEEDTSKMVETMANLDEMVEERDRLGSHLMLKGYSEEEVDAIKADTYVEEEDEVEAEAVGGVDGLDGVSCQTVLDNQGDDVELPEGGSEKAVRETSLIINDLESGLAKEGETSKALLLSQAELQVEEKDAGINKGLKEQVEVTERAEKLQRQVDVLAMKDKNEMERMIQKFIEKDDELRVAQENLSASKAAAKHLQTALPTKDIEFWEMQRREKVLEGDIKAKESLVKRKEELLKDLPARDELNANIGRLRARVADLEAMNLAESVKYIAKLEEDVIYYDKGCIYGAKIDRGNYLGIMETQLGPQTTESIEQGRAVVACELKAQPLDVGESTADTPSA
ncbi:hypothetical protein GIB67_007301 [Kingdonia uniflora]|uniref:Uncharacterized protein n=1 Tax=Kingdonia uniflora TaxID=39325 RepID=A0A7J7NXI2_9MAGN|nr:hypothetical protein GIB67_007301 [Kingdonia uniflora]